jgi:hypothetical protein
VATAKEENKKLILAAILLTLLAAVLFCVLVVTNYKEPNMLPVSKTKVTESNYTVVINSVGASDDLIAALASEDQGCGDTKNIVYITNQVGNIAKVKYGCAIDATMFYKKTDGKWRSISPTNQFINDTPICSMLKANHIPAKAQPVCFDQEVDSQGMPTGDKTPRLIANSIV